MQSVMAAPPTRIRFRLRPQWGVLLLAALVPFHGLLAIAGLPGLVAGWKEGLVLLTLAATFIAAEPDRRAPGTRSPRWLPALLGLLLLAVAWVPFVAPAQAVAGVKIGFFYTLVTLAVWRCPLQRVDRDRLVTIMMSVAVITAAFGIVQQALGGDRLAGMGWEWNTTIRTAGGFLRSFSTFNQPFPFAFTLVAVTLVCLPVALRDRARTRNRLFLFALPVVALGLTTSIVRTAWLALVVGLVFLAVHRYRELFPWLAAGLVIVIAGAVVLGPNAAVQTAVSAVSFGDRAGGWSENLDDLAGAPFGTGLGTTGAAGETAQVASLDPDFASIQMRVDGIAYQPDSQFYKYLLEFGVLGLWLFGLLLISAFGIARRCSRASSGQDADLAAGIAASLVAVAAASVASTYLEIFPLDVLFWLLLGVLVSLEE